MVVLRRGGSEPPPSTPLKGEGIQTLLPLRRGRGSGTPPGTPSPKIRRFVLGRLNFWCMIYLISKKKSVQKDDFWAFSKAKKILNLRQKFFCTGVMRSNSPPHRGVQRPPSPRSLNTLLLPNGPPGCSVAVAGSGTRGPVARRPGGGRATVRRPRGAPAAGRAGPGGGAVALFALRARSLPFLSQSIVKACLLLGGRSVVHLLVSGPQVRGV